MKTVKKVGPIILMALTKMGMWMTDARGKSNGHVITKNRQGQAARTKATPINRRSTLQNNQRGSFTTMSQAWAALTAAQRVAWNNASQDYKRNNAFGDSYSPTGKNLYMWLNQNISLAGGTTVSDPPLNTPPTDLTAFAIGSNTSAAQTLTFTVTPVPAGMTVIIYATRPLSPGISTAGSRYRKLTTIAAAGTSPANTFATYSTVFGTPITGKKIFFKAVVINKTTGIRSGIHEASGITA